MDYSNPRENGNAGEGRSGIRWHVVLGSVVALLGAGYGAYALLNGYNTWTERNIREAYSTFAADVAKADAIADPLQRCLNYPDLPGSHWDSSTTRAYCVYLNHRTVRLQEIDALLQAGKGDEVDRIFRGYLDTQKRDPGQPGLLDIAFKNAGFDDAGENTRHIIDLWKQQSPNSAFALAASGVQYVNAAQDVRGDGPDDSLDDQQGNVMNQLLALAFKDFDRAISIDSSITAAYPMMIHGSGMRGDEVSMYAAAALGLRVDRANFGIRLEMMNHAQPQWRSGFGGLYKQRADDLSLANKNPLLRMVAQNPAVYQAICDCSQDQFNRLVAVAVDKNLSAGNLFNMAAQVYAGDRRLAVEIYSEALRFDPTHVDALRLRSQEMIALGDKQGATASFAAVARRFPDDNAMAAELGNIYAQAGDVKDAEATLLAILQRDPGNYYAMGVLGDLYNHAGHQPQKAEALADIMIREYPEKPGGYIVRSCNQMDHNLPGVYETIHYFIDHFGDDPQWNSQTAEMRSYLIKHPEKVSS